jgi:hypothetical protein
MWLNKVSKMIAKAPKLECLPPTDEAFKENVARAHYQIAVWRYADQSNPPQLEPVDHGWQKVGIALSPVPLPANVPQAPEGLLKLIKCIMSIQTMWMHQCQYDMH